MSRPKRETVMARCAREAVLAAIETYNRPTAEYREQTVAFLLVNAWEVLAKARVIQMNGGKVQAIYRRLPHSRRYMRGEDGEILTISVKRALNLSGFPDEVKKNINGLIKVRNQATHMGVLVPQLKQIILEFSTASVQNFVKAYQSLFGESFDVPYLLPLGFVGTAQATVASFPSRQKELLEKLTSLTISPASTNSDYSVILHVQIELNRGLSGGGSIGLTNDPTAPKVSVSDDEALGYYSAAYADVVAACKERYRDFVKNKHFDKLMKLVKADPECAHQRKLNPNSPRSATTFFYNLDAAFANLDNAYTRDP